MYGHVTEPILVADLIIDWFVMARELAHYKLSWLIIK